MTTNPTQTALAAVLLNLEGRQSDLVTLLDGVPEPLHWSVVMKIIDVAAASIELHCQSADTDPLKYVAGAILAVDASNEEWSR